MTRFAEQGWSIHRGLVAEQVHAWKDRLRALEGQTQPLLRQLTSRPEPHDRDPWGRIRNPVVLQHLPAFGPLLHEVLVAIVPALPQQLGPPALTQAAWAHSTYGTALHVDPHPIEPDAPMIGAWVALEDVGMDAGPFTVVPGSLEFDPKAPDVAAWRRASKTASEAQFQDQSDRRGSAGLDAAASLDRLLIARGLTPRALLVDAGDVIFWNAQLVHGSLRPEPGPQTRQSLLLHFIERRFAG